MIDIDLFKQINDSYGHHFGDMALQRFVRAVKACLRDKDDEIYRRSGDEFILILKNIDPENVLIILERIRRAVAAIEIVSSEDDVVKFTCSIGSVNSQQLPAGTAQDLLVAADKALYLAKGAGRNIVKQYIST